MCDSVVTDIEGSSVVTVARCTHVHNLPDPVGILVTAYNMTSSPRKTYSVVHFCVILAPVCSTLRYRIGAGFQTAVMGTFFGTFEVLYIIATVSMGITHVTLRWAQKRLTFFHGGSVSLFRLVSSFGDRPHDFSIGYRSSEVMCG